MSIITVWTAGGLGNLLFMIANIFSLSKKYGLNIIIYKSNRYIHTSNTPRKLVWEYDIFKNYNILDEDIYNTFNRINENGFWFSNINLNSNFNYNLHGYFQSYKYFWEFKQEFINSLVNPYVDEISNYLKEIKNKYENKKIISIHFRRTDYLNHPNFHKNLTNEYYVSAVKNFNPDDVYIFFSDDIEWVKQQKDFDFLSNKIYYENPNEELTLWLMSSCDHNIIANSSFSLWASYLNQNPDKKTIAPSKWFGPEGPSHNIYDLIENNSNNIII
jgi:hypothetical protein